MVCLLGPTMQLIFSPYNFTINHQQYNTNMKIHHFILPLLGAVAMTSCSEPTDVVTGRATVMRRDIAPTPAAATPTPQPVAMPTPTPAPEPELAPEPAPAVTASQQQPELEAPAPVVVEPAPVASPIVTPPAPAPAPATPVAQQQPKLTAPAPKPVVTAPAPQPKATPVAQQQPRLMAPPAAHPAVKTTQPTCPTTGRRIYPVMPGQNRGLRIR